MPEAKGSKCGADVFLFFLAFHCGWKVTSRITHIYSAQTKLALKKKLLSSSYCSQISPEWVLNQSRTLKFEIALNIV